jgi:hypothetical protein
VVVDVVDVVVADVVGCASTGYIHPSPSITTHPPVVRVRVRVRFSYRRVCFFFFVGIDLHVAESP